MTYSLDKIIYEYDESAEFKEEYQQNRWGSLDSMQNRMNFALEILPFEHSKTWLDIGCGTGLMQHLVTQKYAHISGIALDVSQGMLQRANEKQLVNIQFKQTDFCHFNGAQFDVISCLGVLQKTNFGLQQFFSHCAELLKVHGQLFVSTKNKHWIEFEKSNCTPYKGHQWFSFTELEQAIQQVGSLALVESGGFLPKENKRVELNNSHDLFLVVEKRHE